MATPTEKLALRLMKALKKEYEREPNITKCRTVWEIATKMGISQREFDRLIPLIDQRNKNLVHIKIRKDGLAAQPNEVGFAWIDSHKEKWTIDRRLKLWSIIVAIVAILLTYTIWRLSQ